MKAELAELVREPVRARSGQLLGWVVSEMQRSGSGVAIVEDTHGRIVGIFTERDLLQRVSPADADWREWAIERVMTADPVVVRVESDPWDALRTMSLGAFRHLPVVDASGRVIGVVSAGALVERLGGDT